MPIRINLLAEAQALEELRRRDPVKRAIAVGVLVVLCGLTWSGYLWTRKAVAVSTYNRIERELKSLANEHKEVTANKKQLLDAQEKLTALQRLATNRFLNGTLLDALQHTTVDDVQLIHLKTQHEYLAVEETKSKPNPNGVGPATRAKPATTTEKITLVLDAKDNSGGDQVIKFKELVAGCSYFKDMLGKNEVRLAQLPPAVTVPADGKTPGQTYQTFQLECRYPEKIR